MEFGATDWREPKPNPPQRHGDTEERQRLGHGLARILTDQIRILAKVAVDAGRIPQ